MPIDSVLIGAGVPIVGDLLNAQMQNVTNTKQLMYNEKMYALQRKHALQDQAAQNLYNSPAEQMRRLREAGLNPNLVYGHGAATVESAPVRSASVESWNPKAPQFDTAAISAGYFDAQVKQAQVDNIKAQTTLAGIEGLLKTAQTIGTEASTSETRQRTQREAIQTDHDAFDLQMKRDLRQTSLEAAKAMLQKTLSESQRNMAETTMTLSENERRDVAQAMNLREAAERIIRSRWERSLIPWTHMEMERKIQLLDSDIKIRELDGKLSEKGIRPGDPIWYRSLSTIVDNITGNH